MVTKQFDVTAYLLKCLAAEEVGVLTAEQEVKQCQESVKYHKERIPKLRKALEALEIDVENLELIQGE